MKKQGFTLIELLVVMGIIGMLAAFVIFQISGAVKRGQDAKIRSQLSSFKVAAETYYNVNDNFGNSLVCAGGPCETTVASGFSISPSEISNDAAINCQGSISGCFFTHGSTPSGAPGKYIKSLPTGTVIKYKSSCADPDGRAQCFALAAHLLSVDRWFCVDSTGNGADIAGDAPISSDKCNIP
ncbi:MAG: type II secretion system protein [bacterium]